MSHHVLLLYVDDEPGQIMEVIGPFPTRSAAEGFASLSGLNCLVKPLKVPNWPDISRGMSVEATNSFLKQWFIGHGFQ